MNTGVISSRYARALFRYTEETGGGERVCRQALTLGHALRSVPGLRHLVADSVAVTVQEKMSLLESALDEPMSPDLRKLLLLVLKKERASCLRFIFHDFVEMYHASRKTVSGKLVSVVKSSDLEEKLAKLVKDMSGFDVILETEINPELIGGFILTLKDVRIDASVKGQFETLRRQFIEQNKRIV